MRNMAYVVEVTELVPIEGCDKIQVIKNGQNGYNVIGSKDVKVGDHLVYFEVDSILPEKPVFEFLRARCYKPVLNGFLIKNMKMRGVYSNGLLIPLADLGLAAKYDKIGKDLTDVIGVGKYEPAEDASPVENKLPVWKKRIKGFLMHYPCTRWLGKMLFIKTKVSGDFPTHLIAKSDEENIQNHKDWFEKHKDEMCYVTTKMEGQSVMALIDPKTKKYGNYNRNSWANPTVQKFLKEKEYEKKLKGLKTHYAVMGEFCDPTVQKGTRKNGSHHYLFNVKNLDKGEYLNFEDMIKFCDDNGFEHVPVLYSGVKLGELFKSVEDMQDFVEHQWFQPGDETLKNFDDREPGFSKAGKHRQEGIVVRALDMSWSFKVKSNEYQLAGL